MDFKELGRLFSQQREQLGVSVADVSESTRINRRIISAFEQGDLSHLPHTVYAKGFIKNYAKALGLDPEESVHILMQELNPDKGEEALVSREISLKEMIDSQSTGIGKSTWPVLLGVLFLVSALALMIWYFSFYLSPPMPEVQDHAAAPQIIPMPVVKQVEEIVPNIAEVAQTTTPISVQASATEQKPQLTYVSDAATPNDNVLHTLSINVTGDEPCWVGIWIPGIEEISKDFTVDAGKSVNYRFHGQRLIRFGHIENVQLTFDGVERPIEGTGVVNLTLP